MTARKSWPAEVERRRKSALRHAQRCIAALELARKCIESNRASEALLQITTLQNHARHIELEMECARVEAGRWGHRANDMRAKARRLAREITTESNVIKREFTEGDHTSALLDLAEQEGRTLEIQVLLVSVYSPPD